MKFYFIILFIMSGCSGVNNSTLKPRTLEDYYVTTGVEKYFLTDIPSWANFDQKAGCFKSTSIRYFNIGILMKSYSINYNDAIQIQASYNEEFLQFKQIDSKHAATLKEEETLFYKVSEKITSKLIFFEAPTFKRVNLVWLDEALGDEKKLAKLKNFLASKTMEEGVPVLVSFCMTRNDVEKKFPGFNTKMITAEMFSVYDSKGELKPGFRIELNEFFKPEQKLYFYTQKNNVPSDEVKGTYKILNY